MFAYFVPQSVLNQYAGVNTLAAIDQTILEKLKLGHIGKVIPKPINVGPSNGPGWLLYRDIPGAIDSYNANSQVWQSMPYPADFYIGWSKETGIPSPRSLRRESTLPGCNIVLGDGRQWEIPAAVDYSADALMQCRLPRSLKITPDGTWSVGLVIPEYRKLWDLLELYLDAEGKAVDGRFQFPQINDWCVAALGTNYYVGPSEVSILELINESVRNPIIESILDLHTFRDIMQKKRAALGIGDTSDGLDVSTLASDPTIGQPTPIGSLTS